MSVLKMPIPPRSTQIYGLFDRFWQKYFFFSFCRGTSTFSIFFVGFKGHLCKILLSAGECVKVLFCGAYVILFLWNMAFIFDDFKSNNCISNQMEMKRTLWTNIVRTSSSCYIMTIVCAVISHLRPWMRSMGKDNG